MKCTTLFSEIPCVEPEDPTIIDLASIYADDICHFCVASLVLSSYSHSHYVHTNLHLLFSVNIHLRVAVPPSGGWCRNIVHWGTEEWSMINWGRGVEVGSSSCVPSLEKNLGLGGKPEPTSTISMLSSCRPGFRHLSKISCRFFWDPICAAKKTKPQNRLKGTRGCSFHTKIVPLRQHQAKSPHLQDRLYRILQQWCDTLP